MNQWGKGGGAPVFDLLWDASDKFSKKNIRGFSRVLRHPVKVCQSPDAASFEALSEEYRRDKNMVYYKWISPGRFLIIELPDADLVRLRSWAPTWPRTRTKSGNTLYRAGGLLVAETVLYEKGTTNGLATVKAELTGGKLKDMVLYPPPGEAVPRPVPDWQIDIFQRPELIKRMVASGDLLE